MDLDSIFRVISNFAGTFNYQLVIALFLLCSIGEFAIFFAIPYALESIWLLAGYNTGAGLLSPLELVALWLVAQAGRQTGATGLYFLGRLPTNLSEPELADWLRRKSDAQEKLADYLTQQARFLSTPGRTLPQWIDFTESGEKDVRAWMRENPIGRRTERVGEDQPPAAGGSEDSQFVKDMQAKLNRGEGLTQAEINRLNVIGRGGQ